ncbi:DUF6510 family protein [Curtobacterium sp. ISL-83]|uniref:DUF6510 family protein n=1 Tax=Curtobacterium sp. ISL-83 TaxID=2819145 RepID=UPI001BE787A4|nr:DUF6510 family protein [Curtobacterium sp. ISL-83]MBT2501127.1 hypothetical protein [Curtobacterium sp. ISL-83]
MTIVDGNALAGVLEDVLGPEPTTALLRCVGCGTVGVLAGARVYRTAIGTVARCRGCDTVLVTHVSDGTRSWVGLPGARIVMTG